MGTKRFYLSIFREYDLVFGLQIGVYPHLSVWIRLPFIEIRTGFNLKK